MLIKNLLLENLLLKNLLLKLINLQIDKDRVKNPLLNLKNKNLLLILKDRVLVLKIILPLNHNLIQPPADQLTDKSKVCLIWFGIIMIRIKMEWSVLIKQDKYILTIIKAKIHQKRIYNNGAKDYTITNIEENLGGVTNGQKIFFTVILFKRLIWNIIVDVKIKVEVEVNHYRWINLKDVEMK